METHMDGPCEICGDVGDIDTIYTCYVCKISRQHAYCMKNFSSNMPMFWRCDDCEDSNEMRAPVLNSSVTTHLNGNKSSGSNTFSTHPGPSRSYREKWVDKGRTKYIPCREAIKLSSGSMKIEPHSKNLRRTTPGPSKPISTRCERTSMRPNPKEIAPKIKENPAFGALGQSKSPVHENKAALHSKNDVDQIRQPLDEVNGPKKDESAHDSLGPPPSTSGGNVCENGEQRSSNAEERSQKMIVSEIDKYSQSLPSRHAYWKGSFNFKLPNGLKHLELSNGFNAHPPSKVRLMIYELLKKMPEVLDFELVPRFIVLTEIFENSCPDKDDIGLYFFPGNSNSSENYASLLEFMWTEKLVLRSYVNGVELFVLTSRILGPDFQKWHGNYYMWAVFRSVKMANDPTSRDNDRELSLIVPPSSDNHESHVGVEDMDIENPTQPRYEIPTPPPGFENSRGTQIHRIPPPPGFENSSGGTQIPLLPGFENSTLTGPPPHFFENCGPLHHLVKTESLL